MHKYQPRIHIVKTSDESQLREFQHGNSDSFSTHIFEETQFMGVTAYQNQQVLSISGFYLLVLCNGYVYGCKANFSCPVVSPTPAVIITGVQFSYLSYSSFTEQCGHSIVMLLLLHR